MEELSHLFLISALVGSEWSALRLGHFMPGEKSPVPTGWKTRLTSKPVWMGRRREKSLHLLEIEARSSSQ